MDALSTREISQTLELRGHLIDSLTLSKVIDRIQQLGGDYRLNDIRIGSLKKDISSVNLTLFADSAEKLAALTAELMPYGAVATSQQNVDVAECPADGALPAEAFTIKLPARIQQAGHALPLNGGEHLVIAVDPQQGTARLEKSGAVKKGMTVVVGTQGIDW